MADVDLHWLTATEVAGRLARGDVSPLEVVEHTLQRIERLEPNHGFDDSATTLTVHGENFVPGTGVALLGEQLVLEAAEFGRLSFGGQLAISVENELAVAGGDGHGASLYIYDISDPSKARRVAFHGQVATVGSVVLRNRDSACRVCFAGHAAR